MLLFFLQVEGERDLQSCVEASKCASQIDAVCFISHISIAIKYLIFFFNFHLKYKSITMNIFTLHCGIPWVIVFCGCQGKQALAH